MKTCLAILMCVVSTLVRAGESPECPKLITFALYENGYIYDSASNTGIDKDVAEELAKRSACAFEFSVFKMRGQSPIGSLSPPAVLQAECLESPEQSSKSLSQQRS